MYQLGERRGRRAIFLKNQHIFGPARDEGFFLRDKSGRNTLASVSFRVFFY